jgi:hypothetical protein
MFRRWRDEVAVHLEAAAAAIKSRQDTLFERHVELAIGYIEQAARSGESSNARRLVESLRRVLEEREQTVQMKFTPDEFDRPSSAGDNELKAPLSLSPARPKRPPKS